MHGLGDFTHIIVGQDHAGRGLDVGRENNVWFFGLYRGNDLFDRHRRECRLATVFDRSGFQHDFFRRYPTGIENLRPTEAEPTVADDKAFFPGPKLARNRLHSVGAAARDQNNRMRVVNAFEGHGDIVHYTLK